MVRTTFVCNGAVIPFNEPRSNQLAPSSDIETWTQTIHKRSEEILKRTRATRASLERQAAVLQSSTDQLSQAVGGD